MAFIDQVQDLTSLTVSDNDELSQFLKDGVIDVTNRWLAMKPQDIENFARESAEQTSNGFNPGTSKIISVIRESGTDGEWYPCNKKPINLQYLVTDVDSLHYASKYNPVYMITQNRNVHVFPAPSSAGNDGFKALYVNYDPEESDGTDLQHDSTGIKWFPDDKVYLVVMYAGIRILNATMNSNVISLTSVPPDLPTLPTVPTTPSDPSISSPGVSTVTVGSLGTAPTLSSTTLTTRVAFADYWTVADFGDSDPGELSITAVSPDTPSAPSFTAASVLSQTAGNLGTAPTYTVASQTFDIAQLDTFIVTDEDSELAQVQLGRLQHELGEYQADIQNNLNEFNEDNVIYQSTVQEALQNLQVAAAKAQKDADFTQQTQIQEYASKIQKYQAELGVYQAEVGAQVQEYTQKLQRYTLELNTVFQAWQKTESDSLQQYQLDIQANLNEFNENNAIYQSTVQEAMQNATIAAQEAQKEGDLTFQATIQDYTQELGLFSGEIQIYQAEVQSLITKYQAETVEYQAEVAAETQEQSVKMQQYQLLYTQLKAEYDQAFMIAAPKQQPQQKVRA
tara:strand:- start:3099 stop:4793 length:1695 start_codon:yes stop_codon:yes gene_type:complete